MDKAVILAAGLGTRMRKAEEGAALSSEQEKIAATGVKALIPIATGSGEARPFLDYSLTALADAGYKRVCMVIGPTHSQIVDYYTKTAPGKRLSIEFATQQKPLGTADAVHAAERFAGDDHFLMINSDNYYPPEALEGLRKLSSQGVALFHRDAMLRGNIAADRISKFSAVESDARGRMTRIHEKPDEQTLARLGDEIYVSMNCWRFGPAIFQACKSIKPSPRGEYEVTDAAQYTIDVLHQPIAAVKLKVPVLDMSSRSDVQSIVEKLGAVKVGY
jgi:dTDP-glucose pyrophosphorylase